MHVLNNACFPFAGNGPSGIAVSYVLAGHRPYLRSTQHPDEMLAARLASVAPHPTAGPVPLLRQDLRFLSQGLEGRAPHPLSLLMDALSHPGADQGLDLPSLLQWRHHPDQRVDHVVLGTSPPGGAWQVGQRQGIQPVLFSCHPHSCFNSLTCFFPLF